MLVNLLRNEPPQKKKIGLEVPHIAQKDIIPKTLRDFVLLMKSCQTLLHQKPPKKKKRKKTHSCIITPHKLKHAIKKMC
jgi:hypothetical protein